MLCQLRQHSSHEPKELSLSRLAGLPVAIARTSEAVDRFHVSCVDARFRSSVKRADLPTIIIISTCSTTCTLLFTTFEHQFLAFSDTSSSTDAVLIWSTASDCSSLWQSATLQTVQQEQHLVGLCHAGLRLDCQGTGRHHGNRPRNCVFSLALLTYTNTNTRIEG